MRFLFFIILILSSLSGKAQLYISPGASVHLTGNAQLTLKDEDLINNGSFTAGNSTILFTGTANSNINGTGPVQFYTVAINKSGNSALLLQRAIDLSNEMQFVQGLFDLNGHNLDLGSTGQLNGESETSRITGTMGGEVLFNTLLNAPAAINPANLGVVISTTANLGNVLVKRGHQPQSTAGGSGINRYYHISSDINSGLNATLRQHYFDAELNSLDEASLSPWRSQNGADWTSFSSLGSDAVQNYVELTGIDAFSYWTLASASATLPVRFTGFTTLCQNGEMILRWTTAQEINSSHFIIEKNMNGNYWEAIGTVAAVGNSNIETHYSFTDPNPSSTTFYRIAQYDIDGQVHYTRIIIANCQNNDALQAWPNPFRQAFAVRIYSARSGFSMLRVTDAIGSVIISRRLNLLRGANQFELDLKQAAAGIYLLTVENKEEHQLKTIRLIKQ